MHDAVPKFLLLSHVLPPSPSGQAVVLYNLLSELPAESYCLVSQQDYTRDYIDSDASKRLPARYYRIKAIDWQLPALNPNKPSPLRRALRPVIQLYNRLQPHQGNFGPLLNSLPEIHRRAQQINQIIKAESVRAVVACTADLYNLPAAYLASRRAKIPFIPYIFDDYGNQFTGLRRTIARFLEPRLLRGASKVIVPNEFMAKEYARRYNIQSAVIHNLSALPDLAELDEYPPYFDRTIINIVYTGSVYSAQYQAFFNLIEAIERLGRRDIKLHIFTSHWHEALKKDGLTSPAIVFHNHLPYREILAVTRQADILFLPLAFVSDLENVIRTSLPGKTGAYLAVGRPILVHAPEDSFISWYFCKHQCGAVADRNDVILLAEVLTQLISDRELQSRLSKRARHQALEDFDAAKARGGFEDLLRSVL